MQSKYVLTYEMKILYCQDMNLNLTCKELNLETLQFRLYDGDREDLETGFELNPNDVNLIASEILMGKVGYSLSDDKMKWLEKFETLLKLDMKLLLNKKVAYSYFVLKLQLLGFSENISKDIMYQYYENLLNKKKVAHPQVLLKNINHLIKCKIFWVPMNLDKEEEKEYQFLEKVIQSKLDMMYKFSFDQIYSDQYLFLCKHGLVNKLLDFNTHPSYLVRRKQPITNLVPYILDEYSKIIHRLMMDIYTKRFLNTNEGFIQDTIKHMETYIRQYISVIYH